MTSLRDIKAKYAGGESDGDAQADDQADSQADEAESDDEPADEDSEDDTSADEPTDEADDSDDSDESEARRSRSRRPPGILTSHGRTPRSARAGPSSTSEQDHLLVDHRQWRISGTWCRGSSTVVVSGPKLGDPRHLR